MKYQPEFDPGYLDPVDGIHNSSGNANKSYVNGDPRIGRKGSIPPAAAFEHPQREILAAIAGAGLTPSHMNLDQLWEVFQIINAANTAPGSFAVYETFASAKHRFRSLLAGDNITLQLVENPAGSGRHCIRINVSDVAGSGSGSQSSGSGGGSGDVLRPCLVGITGDITNLSSCGAAIASSYRLSAYEASKAFDDSESTQWEPTAGVTATDNWIGWDFDPANSGYFGTFDQITFKQLHNASNRTDKWLAAVVQATNDPSRSTWTTIGSFAALTPPGDNAMGPLESVALSTYSARAVRIKPTSVQRYDSASLLIQTPIILEMSVIRNA